MHPHCHSCGPAEWVQHCRTARLQVLLELAVLRKHIIQRLIYDVIG